MLFKKTFEGSKKSQWQIVQAMADLSSLQIHEDLEDGVDHNQIPEATSYARTSDK
jgi:hypothetical protein